MKKPDIAIIYNEHLPSDLFEDFKNSIEHEGLNLDVQSKPDPGPFACSEWFIPTAIVAYVAKSYFDGFLKEAGKEHFAILKKKLAEITQKSMEIPRIEPVILGSQGKVSNSNPYSLAFSIYAEANNGNKFKLLLPKPSDANNYIEIIQTFLEFLNDYHSGVKNFDSIGFGGDEVITAGYIFVHMNPSTNKIDWLDERLYR